MIGGCNTPKYPDCGGGHKNTFDLKGNRDGDHDIIVADRHDDIMSQFDNVSNIGINEVSIPRLTINGQIYTLDRSPFDTSAYRVNGANIIYFRGADKKLTRGSVFESPFLYSRRIYLPTEPLAKVSDGFFFDCYGIK